MGYLENYAVEYVNELGDRKLMRRKYKLKRMIARSDETPGGSAPSHWSDLMYSIRAFM